MSKSIFRQKLTRNFTTIPNDILKNPELSWKAKGIHAYLLSLPETWIVRLNHLKSISTDGYDSTVAGVNELLDKKYLWRRPCCGENPGGWEYYVYQYPQLEDPFRSGDSPTREIPDSGKPATNKDRLSKVNKEYVEKPLTPLQGEEESSAVASHSSVELNQPNLFPNEITANAKVSFATAHFNDPPNMANAKTTAARKKSPPTNIPTELDTPEFNTAWNEFLQHRKEKRAPMTPTAQKNMFGKFTTWGVESAVAAIDAAISNGWTGVFEPKQNKSNSKPERFANF
jgi:hypothetical protein